MLGFLYRYVVYFFEKKGRRGRKMVRFIFVIVVSLPWIIKYLLLGYYIEKHPDKYDEEARYRVAQKILSCLRRHAFVKTDVYGRENLPESGGYAMYSNHQGKYDAVGIVYGHGDSPCTIMLDAQRSKMIVLNQFTTLVKGCRLDKTDPKKQVRAIKRVTEELKQGRRYIIFPEGGYFHNRNKVGEFMPGAFKCSVRSKTPIVPVAVIDSYKPFEINSLKPVTTQVHFLKPIPYSEYKELTTEEISKLVRERIIECIEGAISVCKKAA